MQFADPRTDFAFKKIFGNEQAKEVLISFLNSVLGLEGEHAIVAVTILDPYQAPKITTLKRSYLDVKCRDQRGVEFVVEMQVSYTEGFNKRIQYNACKAYVGQIAVGSDYPKLNQVIAITICDFEMFHDFEHYLSRHEFRETRTNNRYLDEIRHYFIELPKFTRSEEQLETTIEKWCYFLKHAGRLETIPEKLKEQPFLKAFEIANRANMSRDEWEEYDAISVRLQDERGAVTAALKQGERIGIEKGERIGIEKGERIGIEKGERIGIEKGERIGVEKGELRVLKALQQKGHSLEQIAEMTGYSVTALEKLLSNGK